MNGYEGSIKKCEIVPKVGEKNQFTENETNKFYTLPVINLLLDFFLK